MKHFGTGKRPGPFIVIYFWWQTRKIGKAVWKVPVADRLGGVPGICARELATPRGPFPKWRTRRRFRPARRHQSSLERRRVWVPNTPDDAPADAGDAGEVEHPRTPPTTLFFFFFSLFSAGDSPWTLRYFFLSERFRFGSEARDAGDVRDAGIEASLHPPPSSSIGSYFWVSISTTIFGMLRNWPVAKNVGGSRPHTGGHDPPMGNSPLGASSRSDSNQTRSTGAKSRESRDSDDHDKPMKVLFWCCAKHNKWSDAAHAKFLVRLRKKKKTGGAGTGKWREKKKQKKEKQKQENKRGAAKKLARENGATEATREPRRQLIPVGWTVRFFIVRHFVRI